MKEGNQQITKTKGWLEGGGGGKGEEEKNSENIEKDSVEEKK